MPQRRSTHAHEDIVDMWSCCFISNARGSKIAQYFRSDFSECLCSFLLGSLILGQRLGSCRIGKCEDINTIITGAKRVLSTTCLPKSPGKLAHLPHEFVGAERYPEELPGEAEPKHRQGNHEVGHVEVYSREQQTA